MTQMNLIGQQPFFYTSCLLSPFSSVFTNPKNKKSVEPALCNQVDRYTRYVCALTSVPTDLSSLQNMKGSRRHNYIFTLKNKETNFAASFLFRVLSFNCHFARVNNPSCRPIQPRLSFIHFSPSLICHWGLFCEECGNGSVGEKEAVREHKNFETVS